MADASDRKDRRRDFKKRVLRSGEKLAPKKQRRDFISEDDAAAAAAKSEKAAAVRKAQKLKEESARVQKAGNATAYVRMWGDRERQPWRFQKGLQEWWLKHWGSTVDVAKGDFAIFLEYAATIKGGAGERLLTEAQKAAAAVVPETEGEAEDDATKAKRKKRIRARKLVKALEAR